MQDLFDKLDAAFHSTFEAARMMDLDPSSSSIAEYESCLDREAAIRKEIGDLHDAQMKALDERAAILELDAAKGCNDHLQKK